MSLRTSGIHHITAIAGNPRANVDFFAGVLGLRLVKKTVNFDDPSVYHLYYGNEIGSPGTAMTTFPYDGGRRGRLGGGQVGVTTFVVPLGALSFWESRLSRFSIPWSNEERFGEKYIRFQDGDGLHIALVAREEGAPSEWSYGDISSDVAVKGFGGAILYSVAPDETEKVLQQVMGLEKIGTDGGYVRYRSWGEIGNFIDIRLEPMERGSGGIGTVHHIAWRASDQEELEAWRERVQAAGFAPTPFMDRKYFKSIYFRENGGVLFEIATDGPGFDRDEPASALGEKLMLPDWLEPHRSDIESKLPPLHDRGDDDRKNR